MDATDRNGGEGIGVAERDWSSNYGRGVQDNCGHQVRKSTSCHERVGANEDGDGFKTLIVHQIKPR